LAGPDDSRKTPLFDAHKALKAKMVPFGGWMMPVSYSTVLVEHKAVREQCGLFDVSHMGEVFVRGAAAEAFLQRLTINDVTRLRDGQGQYTAILDERGGMIDDLIIYRLKSDEFLVCVNASNADKDFAWIKRHADQTAGVTVTNESAQWSQLAVQGPTSQRAVAALLPPADQQALQRLEYTHIMPIKLFGRPCWLARTGYTGEHGYELYLPNDVATKTWLALLETTPQSGIVPVGLGARDTLRLEACYLLYGNDMDDSVTPLEAGISWAVRMDCGDFVGKDALLKQKETGVPRQLVAFTMTDDGIPRHDMEVFHLDGTKLGKVTSGSVLPTVGGAGGLCLIDAKRAKVDDEVEIDVRGKRKRARLVKKPLYKAKVKG
jgi:aminomethyltransferase